MTDQSAKRPIKPLAKEPKTLALVIGILVLLVGIPAGLYAWAGRWDVAIGLIIAFVAMIALTGYALKVAIEVDQARK